MNCQTIGKPIINQAAAYNHLQTRHYNKSNNSRVSVLKSQKNSETASLLSSSIPPDCLTMIKIRVNTTSELEGYFSPSFFRAASSIQSCYRSHEASIICKQYALGARGFSMATKPTRLHLGVVGAERLPVFSNGFSRPTKSCVDVLRF